MHFIPWNFYKKKYPKRRIYNKTQYVKSNKFTPAKEILHLRCRWCRRHLEGLPAFFLLLLSCLSNVLIFECINVLQSLFIQQTTLGTSNSPLWVIDLYFFLLLFIYQSPKSWLYNHKKSLKTCFFLRPPPMSQNL